MSAPLIVTLISSLLLAVPAAAQPYPSRPIRVVVPFAPGGAVDLVARTIAPKLNEAFGQSVVVANRGGAGGTIGTDIVAKARPDGHTLLVASMGVAVNAVLYPKLPYDTLKDLAPVTTLGEQPNIVVVHPSVPAKLRNELLALARAKPGQLSYTSGGVGSNTQLVIVLFLQMAKVDKQRLVRDVGNGGDAGADPEDAQFGNRENIEFSRHQRAVRSAQGLQPIPTTPEAFAKRLYEEIKKWGGVVKASGAKPE